MTKPTKKWTKDKVIDVVKTCRSMNEVRKKHAYVYDVIKANKWKDVKEHLQSNDNQAHLLDNANYTYDNTPKWTREHIAELVSTCTTLAEFRKRYPRACEKVKKKKWTDLVSCLERTAEKRSWTRDDVASIIAKCTKLSEFRTVYPTAYGQMVKNKWYDLAVNLQRSMSDDVPPVWSVYRWYFPETNAVYIGLTNNYNRRINEELKYSSASPVHDHITETGCTYEVTEVYNGLSSEEACRLEIETIAQSKSEGYVVLNKQRGGSLGSRSSPYDIKVTRYLVVQYDSRGVYIDANVANTENLATELSKSLVETGRCTKPMIMPIIVPICVKL